MHAESRMGGQEHKSEKMLTFCFGYGPTEEPMEGLMEGPTDLLTGLTPQVLESYSACVDHGINELQSIRRIYTDGYIQTCILFYLIVRWTDI